MAAASNWRDMHKLTGADLTVLLAMRVHIVSTIVFTVAALNWRDM